MASSLRDGTYYIKDSAAFYVWRHNDSGKYSQSVTSSLGFSFPHVKVQTSARTWLVFELRFPHKHLLESQRDGIVTILTYT